jgi:chemotaxis protein methyltransferase CheR
MPALPLSPPVFAILSALIEERAGIHYGPADRELLAEKISPRAVEAGFESLLDYYYFLRYDEGGSAELQTLIEQLAVHETYFFRELEQLRVLVGEFLSPLVQAGRRPRVWCAACATGEEPLTLAMLLEARGQLGAVEVVASDISARALAKAKSGLFGRRSVRGDPPPDLATRFLGEENGQVTVASRLRAAIDWRLLNLVDTAAVAALGTFDAIVCRNVLIYFRDQTTSAVVERLSDQLRPGGVMLVGVSESLLRFGTSLSCEERGGSFFYRKAR